MSKAWTLRIETLSAHSARIVFCPPGAAAGPTFAVREPHPTLIPIPESGRVELCDGNVVVHAKPDGLPPGIDNLRIEWSSRGKRRAWSPGDLDRENLGATFLSLDNLWRDYIPQGVHPTDPLVDYDSRIRDFALLTHTVEREIYLATGKYPSHEARNDDVRRLLRGEQSAFLPEWPDSVIKARELVRHNPPGLLTRTGLTIFRDDTRPWNQHEQWVTPHPDIRPIVLYLVYHDCDWHLACRELTNLLGPIPEIPPFFLGVWYSNFSRLGPEHLKSIVNDFKTHGLPLDTISVDMDWHGTDWYGYDWNKELFPDPPAFGAWLRDNDLRATFNVHPLYLPADEPRLEQFIKESGHPGEPLGPEGDWHPFQAGMFKVDIFDRAQAEAYLRIFHSPIEDDGCNFWWIDGCVIRPDGRKECSVLNHAYRTHLARRPGQTPIVFSRAGGLGGHRDPIHFTGDACSQWEVLAYEVEMSIRASGTLMAWVSHDIGGFWHDKNDWPENKPPDDLFTRWVQFGCLSPIMRLHSFDGVREPWRFGPDTLRICRHFMLLRMRLIPHMQSLVTHAHETGVPPLRPMWFEFEDDDAYECLGQYMLGDSLLVVPVTNPDAAVRYWLPPGRWHDAFSTRTETGATWIEETIPLDTIPLWLRDGAELELGTPALRASQVLAGPRRRVTGGNWAAHP